MHELSIAQSLFNQVEEVMRRESLVSLEAVEVEIGAMQMVVPDALQMAWTALCDGTDLQGTRLDLRELPARAKCRICSKVFEPEVDCYLCPDCKVADVEIIEGNAITLKSLTGDTNAPAIEKENTL